MVITPKVPTILWGSPGRGKSSWIESLQSKDFPVETVIVSQYDPAEIGGFRWPDHKDGFVKVLPPNWSRSLFDAGQGVVFLDELSWARPSQQAAALELIRERRIGGESLPDNVATVAAANPPEEAGGAFDLIPPAANRFRHIDWNGISQEDWLSSFLTGFRDVEPPVFISVDATESFEPEARSMVAGFLSVNRELIDKTPPEDPEQAGRAWPSRRSWDMASIQIAADKAADRDDLIDKDVEGCVGTGAAITFLDWLQNLDLPNPDDILKNPKKAEVLQRTDRAFTVMGSVATCAIERGDVDSWRNAIIYASRYEHCRDVAVWAALRPLKKHRPSGAQVPVEAADFAKLLEMANDD